jgi:hypothetical protein
MLRAYSHRQGGESDGEGGGRVREEGRRRVEWEREDERGALVEANDQRRGEK